MGGHTKARDRRCTESWRRRDCIVAPSAARPGSSWLLSEPSMPNPRAGAATMRRREKVDVAECDKAPVSQQHIVCRTSLLSQMAVDWGLGWRAPPVEVPAHLAHFLRVGISHMSELTNVSETRDDEETS